MEIFAEDFLVLLPILAAILISTEVKNHKPDLRIDCQFLRAFRDLFHQGVISVRRDQFD